MIFPKPIAGVAALGAALAIALGSGGQASATVFYASGTFQGAMAESG